MFLKSGDVHYPNPWARDVSASFLLSEDATRQAPLTAGFDIMTWRDDSDVATSWFASLAASGSPAGPTLAVVLGPDFPALTGNLGRNLKEGRIGILSAVAQRR